MIAYAEKYVLARNGVDMQNLRTMKLMTVIDTIISIVKAYNLPDIHKELEDYFESLSIDEIIEHMKRNG